MDIEVEKLVEALEFYANPQSWQPEKLWWTMNGKPAPAYRYPEPINMDRGSIARAALKARKEKE